MAIQSAGDVIGLPLYCPACGWRELSKDADLQPDDVVRCLLCEHPVERDDVPPDYIAAIL